MKRQLPCFSLALSLALCAILPVSASLFTNKSDNTPTTVASFAKSGTLADVITFSADDFFLTGSDSLEAIFVDTLPSNHTGTLTLGASNLMVGDRISTNALSGIQFYPLATPSEPITTFQFTPVFSSGTLGTPANVDLYLLSNENHPPIAQNLSLSTYKNIAITADFLATDSEGDLLTYRLVKTPKRGAVTLPDDGTTQFLYTPYENKTGSDSFTYVAIDAMGNTSAPATVSIQIDKAKTTISYVDMDGHSAHKAAIHLAEEGILVGQQINGDFYFDADSPVSRDQFLVLAMNTLGHTPLNDITTTTFADDAYISTWAKGYVTSAVNTGVIQGTNTSDGLLFEPSRTINKAEASVILNRLLSITDTMGDSFYIDSDLAPTWAYQSAINLASVSVLKTTSDGSLALKDNLTRGDVAEMLSSTLDFMDSKQTSSWFHWS